MTNKIKIGAKVQESAGYLFMEQDSRKRIATRTDRRKTIKIN